MVIQIARLTSNLRNRIDVYTKQKVKNEIGEWEHRYDKLKTVYGQIMPQKSSLKNGQVDTEYAENTLKVKIRIKSLPNLDNTYRLKYRGQIHEVKYFDFDYKNNEFYEIYTRRVIE